MRWICKDDVERCLTQAWRNEAAAALKELNDAPDEATRKAILKKASSSKVWRDFYELLPEQLKAKCWYCEAEDIRSDTPVDHFRPKNRVDGVDGHEGYWWLAFDWENYRCACDYCNSRRVFDDTAGGKACKFPLVDSNQRAFNPNNDIDQESPDFLDPFIASDTKLLWFDNDGKPMAKPACSAEQQRKVDNSIEIFHLHEKKIVRARNDIRIEVERQVRELKTATGKAFDKADVALRKMVRETEKHSWAAIVYLRQHRDIDAVKDILQLD